MTVKDAGPLTISPAAVEVLSGEEIADVTWIHLCRILRGETVKANFITIFSEKNELITRFRSVKNYDCMAVTDTRIPQTIICLAEEMPELQKDRIAEFELQRGRRR